MPDNIEFSPPEQSSGPKMYPNSREAEEAVIGAVLINPEAYYDVAQFLQSDAFYNHRHKWIWEAFVALHDRNEDIDFVTVTEELEQMGHLSDVGGAAYITKLTNSVPSSLHAEAYGRRVEETAIRRRMIEAANKIAKLAHEENVSLETVIDDSEKAVFSVSEQRLGRDLKPIKEVLNDYYDRVQELSKRDGELVGVPTGFLDLDKMLGGLQDSDLIIVAGRPGMGKTGFLLTAAKNAALMHKQHIAVFSMEMSNEQLVQRIISQQMGIGTHRLRTGDLKAHEWGLFTEAIEVLNGTRIFLDDTPALTPLQMRTKCRRLHLEYHLDLIIVDYLQLMTTDFRTNNRVQEVSEISRNLKILAKELNVPVLAAAQLSRAVEQRSVKRPILSDLRESGSLEQDADIVMFIYRPEEYEEDDENSGKENLAEIIVAKHRNGPTGIVQLVFRRELATFVNAARGDYD